MIPLKHLLKPSCTLFHCAHSAHPILRSSAHFAHPILRRPAHSAQKLLCRTAQSAHSLLRSPAHSAQIFSCAAESAGRLTYPDERTTISCPPGMATNSTTHLYGIFTSYGAARTTADARKLRKREKHGALARHELHSSRRWLASLSHPPSRSLPVRRSRNRLDTPASVPDHRETSETDWTLQR